MENNQYDIAGYESYVADGDAGIKSLMLKVTGVHCAGCIQKIESTLTEDPDVRHARLNFTTGALNIEWLGDSIRANDFVGIITRLGYQVSPYRRGDGDAERENRFLLLCMGVAGFATGNIMLLSFGLWITTTETMGFATREFLHWVSALIAIPSVIFCGRPFFRSAWNALKHGRTNMDVPISLALILATGMSVHELLRGAEHVYFDSAVMLAFFLLIGRYLDFRARQNARAAATDLMATLNGFATVIDGVKTRTIPIRDVKAGMIVRVTTGEKFPVDGEIMTGETLIDTSLVTGETTPREAGEGTEVHAGTLNLSAPVTVAVSKAAEKSLLADIVRLMEKAEQGQAAYTRLADRAARLYTPVVHTMALAAFILWWGLWGAMWQDALMIAVTVLIITCPCALGLAVPVAQVLATGRLMKEGVLVKAGDALERLAVIDTVFLDKTGTLTKGRPVLIHEDNTDVLKIGASLAAHSRHPLSLALRNAYTGDISVMDQIKEIPGKGLEAVYQGRKIRLGSRQWCGEANAPLHDGPELWLDVEGDKGTPHRFLFTDELREDVKTVLDHLRLAGMDLVLLSGDRKNVVQAVADHVGIVQAYGEMTPPDKYAHLEKIRREGHKILMIGDGLNDAPVLAGADVSMAPGSAIDMAQNAADIVFMGDKFRPVETTWRVARKTQKIIRENFALAVAYNIIAIPLAFAGMVTPMVAAIAMSGSSILVIANSFRLRGKAI